MRILVTFLARTYFPSKVVADRILPWLAVIGAIAGGFWALLQFTAANSDKRADDTIKLITVYMTNQGPSQSLKVQLDKLLDDLSNYVDNDKQYSALVKKDQAGTIKEEEKKELRALDVKLSAEFAALPGRRDEYARVYHYLNLIVVCAAEERCDRAIVNSTVGLDLLDFLNGTCAFIEADDKKWNTRRTGKAIYDYIISQQLERLSEPKVTGKFHCLKFHEQYPPPGVFQRIAKVFGFFPSTSPK